MIVNIKGMWIMSHTFVMSYKDIAYYHYKKILEKYKLLLNYNIDI